MLECPGVDIAEGVRERGVKPEGPNAEVMFVQTYVLNKRIQCLGLASIL